MPLGNALSWLSPRRKSPFLIRRTTTNSLPFRSIGTPEVAYLVANVSSLYSPELELGFTRVCCSDHQPFHENGFPATQLFERTGPIADPMYHNTGDISDREGFDFNQLRSIVKVQLATLLHVAGYKIKPEDW